MLSNEFLKKFWAWVEFYPEEDAPDYDGKHDGGIKGLKKDAPKEAREAFREFLAETDGGKVKL